jgi:hypothetical protein
MPKRKINPMVLILLLCFFAGGLICMTPFQSCILANDSVRSEEMSEEQKREIKSRLEELKRQEKLKREDERRRKDREFRRKIAKLHPEKAEKREPLWLQSDQERQEFEKEEEKAGGIRFLDAKYALRVSEEQWNIIRPKLEKVINLWDQANSTIGASVSGSSTDSRTEPSGPKLQWDRPWKYQPLYELTEAQRLAEELRILLEKKDTPQQVFRRKVDTLRKARSKEAEIGKQFAEARRELREGLTTRQEAVLVLQGWL